MTTDLQTPLGHNLGPARVPSNPLKAARKVDTDGRPAPRLTRQDSMDFLAPLINGSKASGKVIGLSAKLQTLRAPLPSLPSSSSSSDLFTLHNPHSRPAYTPSHSSSHPAFGGDYMMAAPSPLESSRAGAGGGGGMLQLGAEIPERRKTRSSFDPPPIPQMGPSALRTSTTSSTSLSSKFTTITTTTLSSSSSSMGPPSSTAPVSTTRRTSLRPSTMLKRSTSSTGNVNPYVRAAVLSSSASLSSLAHQQNPSPPSVSQPLPLRAASLPQEPASRLIKPLKPRLSRSISHASSLSLNIVSPPKPSSVEATISSSHANYLLTSYTSYTDGKISPTTVLIPLTELSELAPSSAGPILPAGGGERKRARMSVNVAAPSSGWAELPEADKMGLGSPFLEMSGGADGGMFAAMQERDCSSNEMMEVDEKEEEGKNGLGKAFGA